MFDLWSFQHFGFGILTGSFLAYVGVASIKTWQQFGLFVLLLALDWEATELSMEAGWFGGAIASWKGGYEHWANRFVGDPLMVVLGGMFSRKFKFAWIGALVPVAVWQIINVASPHSMHIQQLVFRP